MHVKLLLFASYRDMAGTDELRLEVPDGATVHDLLATLRSRNRAFTTLPPRPAVAVNLDYAALDTPLQDGDDVALLPPVAGG